MSKPDLLPARRQFAQAIQRLGNIRSAGLIEGLASVPREDFVGPGPWKILRAAAMAKGYETTPDADPAHLYQNVLVALDPDRRLNNGEPLGLLLFLDTLALKDGERLLHVGCGVGYYTAIAAQALGAGGSVVAVEVDPALAARALQNLQPYHGVHVLTGNGAAQNLGAFDAIFVNAGCTRPDAIWLDQLTPGGRLLVPLTVGLPSMPGIGAGSMLLVTRRDAGYDAHFTSPVGIFHCEGVRTPEEERRLAAAFSTGNQAAVHRLRRDPHEPGPECWLHGDGFCLEADPARLKAQRTEIQLAPGILTRYIGRYELLPGMVMTITLRDGGLYALISERPEHPAVPIYPESETGFFYRQIDAQLRFTIDPAGQVTGLVFCNQGQELPAGRLD